MSRPAINDEEQSNRQALMVSGGAAAALRASGQVIVLVKTAKSRQTWKSQLFCLLRPVLVQCGRDGGRGGTVIEGLARLYCPTI